MNLLAPVGPVYQAGTLSGNPLATAAGIATLRLADAGVYAHVDAASATLQAAVADALTRASVPHRIQTAGNLFSVFFGSDAAAGVRNYEDAKAQDQRPYPAFFHAMLDQGVALPPSVFEAWFLSSAHDDEALGRIIDALPAAARAAAEASG
jgi:glutamate-1-semialdehyde 2,1-aminomutase